MNHKYQITIAWSEEDECYLAYLPDFTNEIMQPVTHGDTYQEALQTGLEVMNDSIAEYMREILKGKAKVFESHPITLDNSEPEPDIVIVCLPSDRYINHHPYPEDIYWLIEISNTTLDYDLNDKKRIYASVGMNIGL